MYRIMFYGGIAGTVISVFLSILVFRRKKVYRGIKDLIYELTFGLAFINVVIVPYAACIKCYAADTTAPIVSEISYYDSQGALIDGSGEIIYCNDKITMEFKVLDEDSGIKKSEDGFEYVYVKEKNGEILHYAPPVEEKPGFFKVVLFGDDWPILKDGYFDGSLEIYAQDNAGNIGSITSVEFVYYNGLPDLAIKPVNEDDEKYIDRNTEENNDTADNSLLWTSRDLDIGFFFEDKVGISGFAYSVGDGEEVVVKYDNEINNEDEIQITIGDTSIDSNGVPVRVWVENYCGGIRSETVWVHIDKELPVIRDVVYSNDKNDMTRLNDILYSNQPVKLSFALEDTASGISDSEVYVQFSNGKKLSAFKDKNEMYYVTITDNETNIEYNTVNGDNVSLSGTPLIYVSDLSGNVNSLQCDKVVCYSKKPQLNINVLGTTGKWTNENVRFHLTAEDDKVGLKKVYCLLDGKKVKEADLIKGNKKCELEYEISKTAKDKNGCKVEICTVNMCGSEKRKSYKVYIDKEKPVISLSGVTLKEHYSRGVNIEAAVSDVALSATKVSYYVSRKYNGMTFKENNLFFFPKENKAVDNILLENEGEYTVFAIAVDGAGNKAETKPVTFVVDRTAPELSLTGVKKNSVNGKAVTLHFECMEAFYNTNDIVVSVKHIYGREKKEYHLPLFKGNSADETATHKFEEDGEYFISFTSKDKAGNEAEERALHFKIDCTAPEVEITGTKAYEQWGIPVELLFKVDEYNYRSNRVRVSGKRTDIDGAVHELKLPTFKNTGSVSKMKTLFEEDGIYDISISAKDEAGNKTNKSINFLIDTKKPDIIGVDDLSGGYYKEVPLSDIIRNMFRDLTLSSYKVLLNGLEYDGQESSLIVEGKYNLYVEAVDELGHINQKSAEFIIDNTAPKVLFFGVEDGKRVFEKGVITWKLDDENDRITQIRINGEEVSADVSDLRYNDYGNYSIEIESVDKAGNEGSSKLLFEYAASDEQDKEKDADIKKTDAGAFVDKEDNLKKGSTIIIGMVLAAMLVAGCLAGFMALRMKERN